MSQPSRRGRGKSVRVRASGRAMKQTVMCMRALPRTRQDVCAPPDGPWKHLNSNMHTTWKNKMNYTNRTTKCVCASSRAALERLVIHPTLSRRTTHELEERIRYLQLRSPHPWK